MMRTRDLLQLLRPRIGLLAAVGTAAGCLTAGSVAAMPIAVMPIAAMPMAAGGALLLCGGCSALNQVQERAEDARMARTSSRPLPSGRMTVGAALGVALACLALAATALGQTPGGAAAALFVPVVVLVYNGLYTPLKKRTSLAMLVGALAGALPPVLGFAASGASPFDARALLLAGVFYAWQVPHFWLFARLHREQYAAAGFFVPHDGVGRAPGTLSVWVLGYGAAMLLIPAFGLVSAPALKILVAALALALCLCAWPLRKRERLGFALVNASLMLFLCFLAADALGPAV